MKTLLALLMLVSSAFAIDPVGQGPMPCVTRDSIPDYVTFAIQDRLNDPDSMQVVGWTMPVSESYNNQGVMRGWWSMVVTIRAKNGYGGVVTRRYDLMIQNDKVTRCVPMR